MNLEQFTQLSLFAYDSQFLQQSMTSVQSESFYVCRHSVSSNRITRTSLGQEANEVEAHGKRKDGKVNRKEKLTQITTPLGGTAIGVVLGKIGEGGLATLDLGFKVTKLGHGVVTRGFADDLAVGVLP